MNIEVVEGDLVSQEVDVIVNPWNRNIIPWWLLIPQGVSGAIKKHAGYAPFRELAGNDPIPLVGAVKTTAGRLPHKAIIHVAGISMLWRSSERSVRTSVRSAMSIVRESAYRSVAFPLIGAGTGGGNEAKIIEIIRDELESIQFDGEVRIVRYRPNAAENGI